MKKADFYTLTDQLEAVSPEQRKAATAMLNELGRRDRQGELAAVLSDNCSSCPRCGETDKFACL